jgi:hypothetical protein
VSAEVQQGLIPVTPDSDRSRLSCFGDVLVRRLPRHPAIRRAFLIQEYTASSPANERLITERLLAIARFAPFAAGDYVFIDRSTEAGTLRRRLPLLRALCGQSGFPLRNVLYVSQSSGRVCDADQPPDAELPRWIFFHSYGLNFARAHHGQSAAPPAGDSTNQVLCMNNKIRPQRIAVALAARRVCGDRLLLSWRGKPVLFSREEAIRKFRADFPSLAGEAVDLEESSVEVDPALGNVYGLPTGPAAASFLHLVTESDYEPWSDRFTEKLLKPVAAGRPFLAFGPTGVLASFRSVGFRTFGDVFDESYDQVADPDRRLAALMRPLGDLLRRDHRALLRQRAEACAHNQAFLRTGLEERLVGMLDRRLAEITGATAPR